MLSWWCWAVLHYVLSLSFLFFLYSLFFNLLCVCVNVCVCMCVCVCLATCSRMNLCICRPIVFMFPYLQGWWCLLMQCCPSPNFLYFCLSPASIYPVFFSELSPGETHVNVLHLALWKIFALQKLFVDLLILLLLWFLCSGRLCTSPYSYIIEAVNSKAAGGMCLKRNYYVSVWLLEEKLLSMMLVNYCMKRNYDAVVLLQPNL